MCRLFPPELIEAIATGITPSSVAFVVVFRHIRDDLREVKHNFGPARDLAQVCREMAFAALIGSGDRQSTEPGAQPTAPLLRLLLE